MSILSTRRPHRSTMLTLPALPDWSDVVAGFESLPIWRPFENHLIRVEEHIDDDRYTIRAELPGVDPAKDIDISVRDGQLTITAERTEKQEEGTRSEFRYGSFYRSMPLPPRRARGRHQRHLYRRNPDRHRAGHRIADGGEARGSHARSREGGAH